MWPGYRRLMGADEEGTLGRLKRLRAELVDPKIAEHGGRVIKTTGDGLLLDFSSVVGAVRCVVQVRTAIALRNADLPQDRRIEFRIGVNLGDIIIDGDDILGDGVMWRRAYRRALSQVVSTCRAACTTTCGSARPWV